MKKMLSFLGPHIEDGAKLMLWMFLALAVFIFAGHALMTITFRYPLDYGEAPLVDQAVRLAAGQNIYRNDLSEPPYTISNYPPLYILVLAPFVKLFGPTFLAGRVLSILCTLAAATFLGLTVYTHTRERLAGGVTTMLFLTFPYVVSWSALLRVDMLALALSAAALYVTSRVPKHNRGLMITALLLIAATYTKQSYGLAAPMAVFVWLWTQERQQAFKLVAWVGGVGLALLVVLNILTHGGFVFNVFTANVNPFEVGTVQHYWRQLRQTLPMLLIVGGAFLFLVPRKSQSDKIGLRNIPAWTLIAPYLLGGVISAATIGKIGSNVNYLLELCAALSLTTGILLGWSASAWKKTPQPAPLAVAPQPPILKQGWSMLRGAFMILLAVQVAFMIRNTLRGPIEDSKWRIKPKQDLEYMEWLVETTAGPILADEFMGMLTLNHRPLYIQPFEITQLANAGLWDQTPLLEGIRNQEFPYIFIHHFMEYSVYQSRWTPEMLAAIMQFYAPTQMFAETLAFQPRNLAEQGPDTLAGCPDALWPLPTRGDLGMWWISRQLAFMGYREHDIVPVYAVADGRLTRREDWHDTVIIQHDDPLNPATKVWTLYAGMADFGDSYIEPDFPPGSEGVPVKQGQLLGYQGRHWEQGRLWVHLRFAVLPALDDGAFPGALVGLATKQDAPLPQEIQEQGLLDPTLYLGTIRSQVMGKPVWLPLRCGD